MTSRTTWRMTSSLMGLSYSLLLLGGPTVHAEDVSPPAILQWFEASYNSTIKDFLG